MQLKRGLGRGMESLIPPQMLPTSTPTGESSPSHAIPTDAILPNRLQPRATFDEEKIRELADSIREQGVIQPLIVSPREDGRYELIAGERRLRACRLAGYTEVPARILHVDDEQRLALSIIENIQREDLNALEEARAYQELIGQFGYTQEDVAKKVGKSRPAVANSLRLLTLPRVIQEDVCAGRYSAGHARAILGLEGLHEQLKFREKILREVPTVRDVEKMVQSHLSGGRNRPAKRRVLAGPLADLVEQMKAKLGTKVELVSKGERGKILIEYYSPQDLHRIFRQIAG